MPATLQGCSHCDVFGSRCAYSGVFLNRSGHTYPCTGTYNPRPNLHNEKVVTLNFERIKYWLVVGAQPTVSAYIAIRACVHAPDTNVRAAARVFLMFVNESACSRCVFSRGCRSVWRSFWAVPTSCLPSSSTGSAHRKRPRKQMLDI